MNSSTVITDVRAAAAAIQDKRLVFHGGVYLAGGRDVVVAQETVEAMMRDDLIQRVGRGSYELTAKGKQLARTEVQHA